MKVPFWLTVCAIIPAVCFAQPDSNGELQHSLEDAIKTGRKDIISLVFSHKAYSFLSTQQYDSALQYAYKSLTYFTPDKKVSASTVTTMGIAYGRKGLLDSSQRYYQKALALYNDIKDSQNAATIKSNLAIIYKNKGQYEKALELAFEAVGVIDKGEPDRQAASCYNTIADVYNRISDYPNAIIYYQKSLLIRKKLGLINLTGQSFTNIGRVYISMHQFDSALTNLTTAITIKKLDGDKSALGTTLNYIGETLLELKRMPEAEHSLYEALNIEQAAGETLEEVRVLNNLGKLKLAQNNAQQAIEFLNKSDAKIREIGALDELRQNLEVKLSVFKSLHDYAGSTKAAEELLIVKDSLLNIDKRESLIAMQVKYETERKEQQIIVLEQSKLLQQGEIKSKEIWIQFLLLAATMTIGVSALIYFQYSVVKKLKVRAEFLLQELNHRVKNNLQILSSILSLQSQNVTDENAIRLIKAGETRVNAMALIHKKLYGSGFSRNINMNEYLAELIQYLLHTYGVQPTAIKLKLPYEKINLDVDKAIPIGLIVNELVSNALKYAFSAHATPELSVHLSAKFATDLELLIMDNGPGFSEQKTTGLGQCFGLRMVDTLVKELKGKIKVNSDNSTTYIIQIPIV